MSLEIKGKKIRVERVEKFRTLGDDPVQYLAITAQGTWMVSPYDYRKLGMAIVRRSNCEILPNHNVRKDGTCSRFDRCEFADSVVTCKARRQNK